MLRGLTGEGYAPSARHLIDRYTVDHRAALRHAKALKGCLQSMMRRASSHEGSAHVAVLYYTSVRLSCVARVSVIANGAPVQRFPRRAQCQKSAALRRHVGRRPEFTRRPCCFSYATTASPDQADLRLVNHRSDPPLIQMLNPRRTVLATIFVRASSNG
jgi:hypothetical protein